MKKESTGCKVSFKDEERYQKYQSSDIGERK